VRLKWSQQSIDLLHSMAPSVQSAPAVESPHYHFDPRHLIRSHFDIHYPPSTNLRSPLKHHCNLCFQCLRNIYFFVRSKSLSEINWHLHFALRNPINIYILILFLRQISLEKQDYLYLLIHFWILFQNSDFKFLLFMVID